jgi:hypothetical protein
MEYMGYIIEGDGTYGMKVIKPIGRGSIPLELRGTFTTITTAKRVIDILNSKKEVSNAKVSSAD